MTTFDVAVVGAGPAGIAAATRAAECGARVVVLDESPEMGGQIWRHRAVRRSRLPREAQRWMSRLEQSGATLVRGVSVASARRTPDRDAFLLLTERANAPEQVRARALVIATGARERFLPFPGWTLPGVIGVGGAQALLKSGVSFAGKRVVISGSGPLLLPVAAALAADGARIALVAEQAAASSVMDFAFGLVRTPATLLEAAAYRSAFMRTAYRFGTWVTAAHGAGQVSRVDVTDGRTARSIPCDVLCAAYGLIPNTELAALLGCATDARGVVVNERQETSAAGIYCAGETTGVGGADLSIVEGEIAGLGAARAEQLIAPLHARRARLRATADRMDRAFALRRELRTLARADTIVCRCEDVRHGAIDAAWSMRQAKLYTRAGMGPCQGRICGAALEFMHGWRGDSVRLPSQPVLYSTLVADFNDSDPKEHDDSDPKWH